MIDLRDLIIQRICTCQTLPSKISSVIGSYAKEITLDSESNTNRAILRVLSGCKKKEKERIQLEMQFLDLIEQLQFQNSQTIEQVSNISLAIFQRLDPQIFPQAGQEIGGFEKLKNIFVSFCKKECCNAQVDNILKLFSTNTSLTPFILLEWVCNWSRNFFAVQIQEHMALEFVRHEEQMNRRKNTGIQMVPQKQKCKNAISHSAPLPRSTEQIPSIVCLLSNKQSVFGLFLEELSTYYRCMPLDLDFGFIKSMRRLNSKGNQFSNCQNLQKAAEILADSKNRHIKEEIIRYRQEYMERYPGAISTQKQTGKEPSQSNDKFIINHSNRVRGKFQPSQRLFERVNSETKDEQKSDKYSGNRNSLLLCPKAKDISFESSKDISFQIKKQKRKRLLELPEIAHSHQSGIGTKAQIPRYALLNRIFGSINKSLISNYQRVLPKTSQVTPKYYKFQHSNEQPIIARHNRNFQKAQSAQQPEKTRIKDKQLWHNRKLMLQLLRQKNKHAFLDE